MAKKEILILTCLALLVAVGAALRLSFALRRPIWVDEAYQWEFSQEPYFNFLRGTVDSAPSQLLTRWSVAAFGQNEWALRLSSVLIGLVNIPAVYWLGKKLIGPGAGLLLAALLAVDPLFVETDANARMYSLWLLSAILVFAALVRLYRAGGQAAEAPLGDWVILGLSLALTFWTHMLSAYLWLSVALVIGADAVLSAARTRSWDVLRRTVVRASVAFGLATVLTSPWWYVVLREIKHAVVGYKESHPQLAHAGLQSAMQEFAGMPAFPLLFIAGVLGLVVLCRRKPRLAMHLLVSMPAGFLALWCVRQSHFLAGRYLYLFFVPVYVGIAVLLAEGWRMATVDGPIKGISPIGRGTDRRLVAAPRVLRTNWTYPLFQAAIVVLAVAGVGWRTAQTVALAGAPAPGRYEGSWLVQYVNEHSAEGDVVVLISPHLTHIAKFYGLADRCAEGNLNGNAWLAEGYGYRTEDIPVARGRAVWIVIQWAYTQDPWAAVTQAQLSAILPRALGMDLSPDQVKRLGRMSILKILDGKIWTAKSPAVIAGFREGVDAPMAQEDSP